MGAEGATMTGKKEKIVRAAGVVCYRPCDDTILLLRHDPAGHWGVPKGHRDPSDESDEACALRELAEEAGPAAVRLVAGFRLEDRYTLPATKKKPPRAKRVINFLGIWPEGSPVALSDEHDAYAFASEAAMEALVAFENTRAVLRQAFARGRAWARDQGASLR